VSSAEGTVHDISLFADLRCAPRRRRFGLNWFKIRLWDLTQYDAVLYVDADVEVHAPHLAAVFDLPTDFAVALDLNKAGYWYALFNIPLCSLLTLTQNSVP
jgi:alpha-N-acetylglucosamine transferase